MTIVAWDGKTLAGDTQLNADGVCWAHVKKIKKINGWLIGAAGNLDTITHFMTKFDPKNIETNKAYTPINPAPSKGDFEGLAISPKGKIYYIEDSGVFVELQKTKFIAIGSGHVAAMVAMHLGEDAVGAAKLACKYINSCGGKVQSLKL